MAEGSERVRIDRTKSATGGGFAEGETEYLHFTLDHNGVPFLDELGGGWVSGEGPGWVLHYRSDPSNSEGETAFFPGIALTEEDLAVKNALDFLGTIGRR